MCVKKNLKNLVFVAFFGTIGSFAWGSGSEHEGHSMKKEMEGNNRKELSRANKNEVEHVFKVNEDLHQAFFNYSSSKVEDQAKKLASAIEALNSSEIKKLLTYSASKLKEVKASNTREKNNQIYHMVSTALVHVLNTYKVPGEYNAYYCPMVKKNWVQNSQKIAKTQNPYTPDMKMCGDKKTSF